jgi:adenine-specific DNA glycosylase
MEIKGRCPVSIECKVFQVNRQLELPVKTKKPERKVVKRYVAVVERDGTVLMNKLPGQGLLGGMWCYNGMIVVLSEVLLGGDTAWHLARPAKSLSPS